MPGLHSQFNGGNHITVSRHNYGEITIILICVGHYLCGYSHIGFLFFMCMNLIAALKTGYLFL